MKSKIAIMVIALALLAAGASAQTTQPELLGLTPYKVAGGRVQGGEGFHQTLGDFLTNGLGKYMASMKYRKMSFLSQSQSGTDVTGWGFLVEINLDDCETTDGQCDVFFVVPRLGDPSANGSQSAASKIGQYLSANGTKQNGWYVPLEIIGTLSSVDALEDGTFSERIGVNDYVLGLKVKGQNYRYNSFSQSYCDDVVYWKEMKERDAKKAALEAKQEKEEQKELAAKEHRQRVSFLSLGLHSGQSQATVKSILKSHGFSDPVSGSTWVCVDGGWEWGIVARSCTSLTNKNGITVTFETARRYRSPDGSISVVRTDRLLRVTYATYPSPNAAPEIDALWAGGYPGPSPATRPVFTPF